MVAATIEEALEAVDACFAGAFGAAGAEVVIEDLLVGEEASFFAISDGTHVVPLAAAQDHKRVGDGDTGPNTGGMGAYSPAAIVDDAMAARIMAEIVEPTVACLKARGTPFVGVLFAGLMIEADGPQLIEYNARFGDPETEVVLPRLKSDLLELMVAAVEGRLAGRVAEFSPATALTVVMASKGYIRAITPRAVASRGSTKWRPGPAFRCSMPAPRPERVGPFSPTAAASWPSPPRATASPLPSRPPTPPSTRCVGRRVFAAVTSAGGRWRASGPGADQARPATGDRAARSTPSPASARV